MLLQAAAPTVALDIVVLALLGYVSLVAARRRPQPGQADGFGNLAMIGGCLLIALACLADLVLVFGTDGDSTIATPQGSNRTVAWLTALVGIACLAVGLAVARRRSAQQLEGLAARLGSLDREIAESNRDRAALQESETLLRTVFDSLPVAIGLKDREGRYTLINKECAVRVGISTEEARGKTFTDLFAATEETVSEVAAHEQLVIDSKSTVTQLRDVILPDGTDESWLIAKFPVLDSDADVVGVGSADFDMTERRRAERALQEQDAHLANAAAMAKLGYWVWDELEDKAIHCSEEHARIYGLPSGAELVAELASTEAHVQLIHPDDRADYRAAIAAFSESGRGFDIQYRIKRADGRVLHLHDVLKPVFDEHGRLVRSNGITQDVSDQKATEELLRQAQKMEAVGQLTAGVAHDFNNLLAVIQGNGELLSEQADKDDRSLASILRASRRGAELTQRLLAFSRRQVLHPKVINANALISESAELLRRTLEATIEIETVTSAGLWNCEVDPAQLENSLLNLAINARDAMPKGGKLTLETANARLDDDYAAAQAEVAPGQYVMLAVTDTGSGMPPDVREHIFEPFFTTKQAGKGSGLGLSMIYGFVKQSGGHVMVYSEPGEGTTIKLYLPRSTHETSIEETPAMAEIPVAQGESVLVVEDDPDVRDLAVALLESLDYKVTEAATATKALDRLASAPPIDLLLTDVVLSGGMNGRQLAERAASRSPDLKILYMSGYTENAIVHHGRLDSGVELLQKPFRRADLARAVRKVLAAGPAD